MAPRREEITPAPVAKNANLLSMSRFLGKIEHEDMVYALLPRETNTTDENPDLPAEVQQMLTEFSDLMPKDLPWGCRL